MHGFVYVANPQIIMFGRYYYLPISMSSSLCIVVFTTSTTNVYSSITYPTLK